MVKVFRELTIFGEPRMLELLISRIESRLSDGWSRGREREQELRRLGPEEFFIFLCGANAEHPALVLALLLEGRRIKVTNIFPQESGQITVHQYNSALVDFYLRFLHAAAFEAGLSVELSSDERSIEEAFHPEVLGRLKTFVFCAEGLWSRPSWLHPFDQKRLFAFLIEAQRHSNKIDTGLFRHWLENDRHWPSNKVDQLLAEVEFGADLLAYLDEDCSIRTDCQVLLTTSAPPADPSLVGRERTPLESRLPSGSAQMLRSARQLVLTAFNAIATAVRHTRRHRSGRQAPAPGLSA
ncbi:MAG: hypothetical protein WA624_15710 [Methylocella sp.]